MIAALLLGAALTAFPQGQAADTLPRITLAQAIQRATQLDPQYVRALGDIGTATWARRSALAAFVTPSVNIGMDLTKYSTEFFNIGTGVPVSTSATARAQASYQLFSLRKFAELARSRAVVERAEAGELDQRFRTALLTESDYYDVLANHELARVAEERTRRAQQALEVARARVLSGAAVQSDSLQLVLELSRAQVDLLRQRAALRTSQLQLGRRVGEGGAVDATPLDTLLPGELPVTLDAAVREALERGPKYQVARANERSAEAALRSQQSDYLPQIDLLGQYQRFDSKFFPSARNVASISVGLTFPLWNGAQREVNVARAGADRDVARAQREDVERGARRDVTQAYDAYTTARAAIDLSGVGVAVARENFRVQELRYRTGATTILDLLDAQLSLAQADADLVQARFEARRARAGLEAILGRRLPSTGDAP